jgi:hypothetical protein
MREFLESAGEGEGLGGCVCVCVCVCVWVRNCKFVDCRLENGVG